MFDFIANHTVYRKKYRTASDAVIVSCFFNPENSPYRVKAFLQFYESIKHLNHSIIECVIGDAKPQLNIPNVQVIKSDSLLWHKETLLNKVISELPEKYKYVMWIDADVIFTNKNWMVDAVKELKKNNVVQLFEYCVHLEKDEKEPAFNLDKIIAMNKNNPNTIHNKVWRSFCANYATSIAWKSEDYNTHGHVGFAWGAKRSVLRMSPLYDRALIGGADHIMAHAAVGQINHSCITKSFTADIDSINVWSREFYAATKGKVGYVKGRLYHIWHGDIKKRDYLNRVREFTPMSKDINEKDKNGLFVSKNKEHADYMKAYFSKREVDSSGKHKEAKPNGSCASGKCNCRPTLKQQENKSSSSNQSSSKPSSSGSNYNGGNTGNTTIHNHYHNDSNSGGSFLTSAAVGYMTDSPLIGGLVGGDFIGGFVGAGIKDHMNNNDNDGQGAHSIHHGSHSNNTDSVIVDNGSYVQPQDNTSSVNEQNHSHVEHHHNNELPSYQDDNSKEVPSYQGDHHSSELPSYQDGSHHTSEVSSHQQDSSNFS